LKKRHLTIVGLSLLAAVSLAVGGCDTSGNGQSAKGSASPSPSPADPKSALLASVEQLSKTPYKYHMESEGMTGDGVADPVAKAVSMAMTAAEGGVSMKMDIVVVNADFWVKMDLGDANALLGIPADKYMHLDTAKLGDSSLSSAAKDADLASGMFDGLLDVKQVDSQHFTGTIDLTKASGDAALGADTLKKAGDKAKSASFTASVDGQGRLTELTIDTASLGLDQPLKVSYSDYGTAATVNKPAASKVTEAPSKVYDMFKNAPASSSAPSTK
jgi:hypothetical protein